MAEREGFEPSVGVAYTRLAGEHLQPLGHLSRNQIFRWQWVDGGGGIRTPGRSPYGGFQDRCLQPLGHSSSGFGRGNYPISWGVARP